MEIVWEINKKKQIRNFKFAAKQIYTGFYQEIRFYVLPYLPKKFRSRVIFFPEITSFNEYFSGDIQLKDLDSIPSNILNDINLKLEKLFTLHKSNLLNLKYKFSQIQEEFIKCLEKKFPKLKDLTIFIYPSIVGSIGSYYLNKKSIEVNPRFDRNAEQLCKTIITSLTHFNEFPRNTAGKDFEMLKDKSWYKKQKKSNDNAKLEIFTNIIKNKKGILDVLYSNFSGNLVLESSNYLQKLKYPIKQKIQRVNDIKNLTKTEKNILSFFTKNRKEIISFEKIADILWQKKSFEKYSLYAIAKHIERLRKKLKSNGQKVNLIHTQRGKGYILYD